MTEAEWLAATDPAPMLWFLSEKVSERKLRLFAVACCRRIWNELADDTGRNAVEVAEMYADGLATKDEINLAADAVCTRHSEIEEALEDADEPDVADISLFNAVEAAWKTADSSDWLRMGVRGICDNADWALERNQAEYPTQCNMLRDIFGPLPFRPVSLDPAWLTSPVRSLAGQMYQTRDFSPMPILADALQEAGCDHPAVLDHCRGAGPHVRGCWVVDLLTGRT